MCGYTLSEAYWRIRDNKGLMNTFDRETLELWSKVITKFRRHCGSPAKLDDEWYDGFIHKRQKILEDMERYRDLLVCKADKQPIRLGGDYTDLAGAAVLEQFNLNKLDWKLLDEDSLQGFIESIDYDALNKRINELIPRYKAFLSDKNKKIEQLEAQKKQLFDELNKKREVLQHTTDSKLLITLMHNLDYEEKETDKKIKDFNLAIVAQKLRSFLDELPDEVRGELQWVYDDVIEEKCKDEDGKEKKKIKYKVWQIRTDVGNRSSIGADISKTLYYFWNVKQYTDEQTRKIINDDLKCIDDYLEWKVNFKKEDEEYFKKFKKHKQYKQEYLVDRITEFYQSIRVPRHPLDSGGSIYDQELHDKYEAYHKTHPDVSFDKWQEMRDNLFKQMQELGA